MGKSRTRIKALIQPSIDIVKNPTLRFAETLTAFNLVQHVTETTHESGHLLDLVISRPNDFVSNIIFWRILLRSQNHFI